jgi:hypothetical protein
MVEGSCLCGGVRIELDRAPEVVTSCDCEACRRLGVLWCYDSPRAVRVVGPTATFQRGERTIRFHRCVICGCTTHWSSTDPASDRMGVNARLLEPVVLRATRVRLLAGADDSWAERFIDPPPGLFP